VPEQIPYLDVTIVTPFGSKDEYTVKYLRAPGTEGDFGVLPEHISFLSALRIGVLALTTESGTIRYAVSGGFAQVLDDRVTILAETAERADAIDLERAERAKASSLSVIRSNMDNSEVLRARVALQRALNRIRVAKRA